MFFLSSTNAPQGYDCALRSAFYSALILITSSLDDYCVVEGGVSYLKGETPSDYFSEGVSFSGLNILYKVIILCSEGLSLSSPPKLICSYSLRMCGNII